MERPGSRTSQDQEEWYTKYGNKIDRKKYDEFRNLAEGEWAVDCGGGGFA